MVIKFQKNIIYIYITKPTPIPIKLLQNLGYNNKSCNNTKNGTLKTSSSEDEERNEKE